MKTIDLTPLYRTSVGFDRLATLLDATRGSDAVATGFPAYNIEVRDENRYAITLAVAGFERSELDINVEKDVLTVSGRKEDATERNYLHQGIANRAFKRKFNLADHVQVTGADLRNGLLEISLVKEIPEAMKPRSIAINDSANTLEHSSATNSDKAA
ncbi:MAG: Hsp20 family protein [Pseudomonadota bacterium]